MVSNDEIKPLRFSAYSVVITDDDGSSSLGANHNSRHEYPVIGYLESNYDVCRAIVVVGIIDDHKVVDASTPNAAPWIVVELAHRHISRDVDYYAVTKIDDTWFYLHLDNPEFGHCRYQFNLY